MGLPPTETLEVAVRHHQQGNLQEADDLYCQLLAENPNQPEVLHLKGVLANQLGDSSTAVNYLQQAIELAPLNPRYYVNLGTVLQQQKNFQQALEVYRHAIQLEPSLVEAYFSQGLIYHQLGAVPEAVAAYQAALQWAPDDAKSLHNLGVLYQVQGLHEQALQCLERVISLRPHWVNGYNSLGNFYQETEQWQEALSAYQQALDLEPTDPTLLYNMGMVYHQLKQFEQALAFYQQALAIDPNLMEVYRNLGALWQDQGEMAKALEYYQKAEAAFPKDEGLLGSISYCYQELGLAQEARDYGFKAFHAFPHQPLLNLKAMAICPAILPNETYLKDYREQFEHVLTQLEETPPPSLHLDDLPTSGFEPCFYLPYHGLEDTALKSRLGDLYARLLAPRVEQYRVAAEPKQKKDGRIHVGFVVTENHEGIFCKFMAGFLNQLSQEKFHLTVVCPATGMSRIQSEVTAPGIEYFPLPRQFTNMLEQIAAQQFDVLFYYEIGTDSVNYFLPFFRLAPVQCTSWGVPMTTGIPNVDYFLSSDCLEGEDSPHFYREKLIHFPHLPAYYTPPALKAPHRDRQSLGLSEKKHLYVCPQSLFKLHPQFDQTLGEILRQDPEGEIYLLEGKHPTWRSQLTQRFEKAIPDVLDRVRWLPRQSPHNFLQLIHQADVLLDPFFYGGGNTSYEGIALGIPIVTLPWQFMRGRITAGCYQTIGVTDCIATTPEEYVQLAVGLGTDRDRRQHFSEKIQAHHGGLFEQREAVLQLETFFEQVVTGSRVGISG